MTTYGGAVMGGIISVPSPLLTYSFPVYPAAKSVALDPPSVSAGAGSWSAASISYVVDTWGGAVPDMGVCGESGAWVYGKIYLSVDEINAGAVSKVKQYTLDVWNAHLHERSFLSKSISQSGVTLNNGTLPILFYPTETKSYTITIDDDGPITINAEILLGFTGSENLSIIVSGFRAAMWSFWPQIPITETIKPLTWIFESENGKEQRGKLRDVPRRSFSFDALLNPAEWRNLQNILRVRHGISWVLPLFEQAQFVTATYNAGDTVVTVDTTAGEYYAGGLVIVWKDYLTWFISEVASVASGSVTLQTAFDTTYSGALRIMPAVTAKLASAVSTESDRPGNRKVKPAFEVFEGKDLSGASDAVTLNGYGVMTLPTEADQVPDSFKTEIWSIDYELGLAEWGTTKRNSLRTLPQKTTLMDRAAIYAFKRWVHTKHGAVPFWVPTRFKDLYLSANLNPTASSFRIVNDGLVDNSTGAAAVALFYSDGTTDYRLIDSISAYSSTETTINLNAATTNAGTLTPADVRICFLLLCRLDGDVKMQHTGYDAAASFTVKEVMQ